MWCIFWSVDVCPHCGCSDFYAKKMTEKAILEGSLTEKDFYAIKIFAGMIPNPEALKTLPMGTTTRTYRAAIDICKNCHTLVATRVTVGEAHTEAPSPEILVPGFQESGKNPLDMKDIQDMLHKPKEASN